MSKFSITQLEVARKNPTQFANNLKAAAGAKPSFFRTPKFTRWQNSVNEYHKQNDLSKAINYLEKTFSHRADTAKNRKEVISFIISLDAYVAQFEKKGFTFMKMNERVHIDLNAKVFISGQVPINYMNNKGGFSVYFFIPQSLGWEAELRFPIIQNYFAKDIYGVKSSKIEVGVFGMDTNKFSQQVFSEDEISDAEKELMKIGKVLFDIL